MADHSTVRERQRKRNRKKAYKVTNWHRYNKSLIARGSLLVWVSEDAIRAWRYHGPQARGSPFVYSDDAVECLLTLRTVFRLTLRRTQGFAQSLFLLLECDLPVPDYSTLCRRAEKLAVTVPRLPRSGALNLVMDSTGLKVYGEGEWKVRMHGYGKHRAWRKLHIAVNPDTHELEAVTVTGSDCHDGDSACTLLAQTEGELGTTYGDGSYDRFKIHEAVELRGGTHLAPPQRNARIRRHGNCTGPPLQRDEYVRAIRRQGRRRWKRDTGYHRRSLVETSIFRLKTHFGDHASHRTPERQQTDARIRCRALNIMTSLGMPDSVKVS